MMTARLQNAVGQVDTEQDRVVIKNDYKSKKLKYQIGTFILCYVSYGCVHIYREFWASSKVQIEANEDKYHSPKETLSRVDTVNFMVYGITQFITGPMGDAFNLRLVLPIAYLL